MEPVGVGFAVLAAFGLAVQSLAVRRGAATRSVTDALVVVFAVNLLVLIPLGAVAADGTRLSVPAVLAFATAGLLGSLVGRACYFAGIARLGASRTEPLKALFPLVAIGGAVLVLGERVTPTLLAGTALLVAGGIVVARESRASPVTPSGAALRQALAFPLLAALLYGVDPVFTKVGLESGTPALVGVAVRTAAAAAGIAVYLAVRALWNGRLPSVGGNRWLAVAGVANTTYLLAYFGALARLPVAVATPVLGVSTLFVVAGAALFLQHDEQVTWRLAGASAVVVAGVSIVVQG